MPSFLRKWFHPLLDAIFSTLPLRTRYHLLLLQPVSILTYSVNTIATLFSRRFSHISIPTRSGSVNAILFQPPPRPTSTSTTTPLRLRPLHLDIHGGGFIGGHPEADHRFCTALSDCTGAVVIATSYRFAPKHPFPAAIDDIDDVVSWLLANAASKFHADPTLFTISGSSAGGNLALAACLQPALHGSSPTAIKAALTFYAPVDMRIPPIQKPRPENFPKKDPFAFMLPLYDAYPAPSRPQNLTDPRCNPILAPAQKLPRRVVMVVPEIDILVHEQLTFVKRVQEDIQRIFSGYSAGEGEGTGSGKGKDEEVQNGRMIEAKFMKDCFHGWLELPDSVLRKAIKNGVETRLEVFERCVEVVREVHREGGWNFRE